MALIEWTQLIAQETELNVEYWRADPRLVIDTQALTCTAKIEGYATQSAYENGAPPVVTNEYLTVDVSNLVQGGILAAAVRTKLIAKQLEGVG